MLLADTSIWIDHFRNGDDDSFAYMLEAGLIIVHPFIIGELAMGNLRNRQTILSLLMDLPKAVRATHDEVLSYVSRHQLFGIGIGYVDAHLLASTQLTPDTKLWTRDKRLREASEHLDLCADLQ